MSTDLQWDNAELERLLHDPEGPVGRDLEQRVIRGESAAKRLLSTPGTGRVYVKRNPTRVHRASAPGQPPAIDLGHLRASVGHHIGVDELGMFGDWGTDLDYGLYLEAGTRHMAPRPWLRPSLPAAGGDSVL